MATDVQLGADFWLHELPHWEEYSSADVARYGETVSRVLQPLRNRFGAIVPTSGRFWSDGRPRTGAHAHAGTVDFTSPGTSLREVWEWGATYLVPAGYIGRWIYEPARTGANPQGEHIHMAPRAAMDEQFADRRIQVLEETTEGSYVMRYQLAAAIGSIGILTLLGGAALLLELRRRGRAGDLLFNV